MSKKKLELSRRKTLAALGAVGAASTGAGLGTSAFFTDQESFENNRLTAGELDLKMDWEEHYSFPQYYDAFSDPAAGLDVRRTEPDNASEYIGLPYPDDPMVWVHREDFQAYFQRTTIEAFPDDAEGDVEANFEEQSPCQMLADVPGDLDAYNDEGSGRTRNEDTYDAENDAHYPLLNLTDVKPGDFGEFTFSAHLCSNDGYLWLQMPDGLRETSVATTEPERAAMNAGSEDKGELAENIETVLWYDDDCSNTINGEPEPLSAIVLIDTSGSIGDGEMNQIADASNKFVEELNSLATVDVEAGVITFSSKEAGSGTIQLRTGEIDPGSKLTDVSNYVDSRDKGKFDARDDDSDGTTLLPAEGSGGTPLPHALDLAREVLNDHATHPRQTILVISDGEPQYFDGQQDLVDENDATLYTSDYFDGLDNNDPDTGYNDETLLVARDIDVGGKTDVDSDPDSGDNDISGEAGIEIRTVGLGTNTPDLNNFLSRLATRPGLFYNSTIQTLDDLVDEVIDDLNVVAGEKEIFRGTLQELERELYDARQGPLPLDGSMTTSFDETEGAEDSGPDDGRECFTSESTHCFGLAWWLPEDVGNEIQGDSVGFDLGFYTEQCRHNDGSGTTEEELT